MSGGEPIRYGGWGPDRQTWLLGLTGAGWTAVVVAGLPLLGAVGAHQWTPAAGWLAVWLFTVAGVAVPVRGRPGLTWLRDVTLRGVGAAMGWTRWQSRAATGHPGDHGRADLPGVLSGITTHDGPPFGALQTRHALVHDAAAGTWAVVARVWHPGIGLTETGHRARMAAGLAELLEGAAIAELVSVLALQVRTLPDDGAERAVWQRNHLRADAPALSRQVSDQLSAAVVAAAVRHETFVTVVVPEQRIARASRQAGGGIDGRARVLHSVMAEVEARLVGQIGATGVSWLDSPSLAAAIRTGFAPGERAALVNAALGAGPRLPMTAAGPSSAPPPAARHYVHDAWSSVTCTVLLPDKGAVMGALAPVLAPGQAGERRSMTVFLEPIPAGRADRIVGREAISAGTAAEMRTRLGFATRAAHRRDAARVGDHDARLASGKALVRTAIAAATTVPSTWSIAEAGRGLEATIRAAGFTPLRLDLAQDSGFAAACIPLGIGLPRRRGAL
ncbi:SCO6880 family protein [Kineosporia sp. R_H_3]|uniref:SCO6880 family protein n=1 Tax=Kineosporia sp. R_H_3 TaxID=1961848 RepID=UPI0018E95ECA|nr:SCO6880 family protein [Kineosporia sp. R_H_3]